MQNLNAIRRSLVNYALLLGMLSAMGLVADLSGRQVQDTVATLEANNRQLSAAGDTD